MTVQQNKRGHGPTIDGDMRNTMLNWWKRASFSLDRVADKYSFAKNETTVIQAFDCAVCAELAQQPEQIKPLRMVEHILQGHRSDVDIFSPLIDIRNFEHVTDQIPDSLYFPYFGDIARRARSLLFDKTNDQICFCSFMVRVRTQETLRNFDHALALQGEEPYDISKSALVLGDVAGLKMWYSDFCEGRDGEPFVVWVLPNIDPAGEEEIDFYEHEVFAVLALAKLVESVWAFESPLEFLITDSCPFEELAEYIGSFSEFQDAEREAVKFQENLIIAGKFAMEAIAAICHAEYKKAEFDRRVASIERQSAVLRVMQEGRHKTNRQVRSMVLDEWNRLRAAPSYALNAERNGLALSSWLREQEIDRAPRVVAGWLREYAETQGIRWR